MSFHYLKLRGRIVLRVLSGNGYLFPEARQGIDWR